MLSCIAPERYEAVRRNRPKHIGRVSSSPASTIAAKGSELVGALGAGRYLGLAVLF
jgi:hypothetical protein